MTMKTTHLEPLIDEPRASENSEDLESQEKVTGRSVPEKKSEVSQQMKSKRCLNLRHGQLQLLKFVIPVQSLVTVFIFGCAITLFKQDTRDIRQGDARRLYLAGLAMQGYFVFIALRDMLITGYNFVKGRRNAITSVLKTHFLTAFLDLFILGALSLLALPFLGSCADEDEGISSELASDGCRIFRMITAINTAFSFIYLAAHCCLMPLLYSRDA